EFRRVLFRSRTFRRRRRQAPGPRDAGGGSHLSPRPCGPWPGWCVGLPFSIAHFACVGRLAAVVWPTRDQAGRVGQSTYSELTDSPKAILRIVSASSSATLSWRILPQASAADDSGMVSVTTSSSSAAFDTLSIAAPESTGCVQYA